MKWPKVEPAWGLIFGFAIAPVACALNAALLNYVLLGSLGAPYGASLSLAFLSMILTGPMGYLTTRLLEIWNKGDTSKARGLGLGCGVFSLFFWFWAWDGLELSQRWGRHSAISLYGALTLPCLWSLLFPLFAIFARPPRK